MVLYLLGGDVAVNEDLTQPVMKSMIFEHSGPGRRLPLGKGRFSRTVPFAMSERQRELFLKALETNYRLRDNIETVTGIDFTDMTDDEKIEAVRNYEDQSFVVAELTAMAKANKELDRLAARERGDIALREQLRIRDDELETVRAENRRLRSHLRMQKLTRNIEEETNV